MNRFLIGVFAAVALSVIPAYCFGKDDQITVKGEMKTFTSQKKGLKEAAKKEKNSNFSNDVLAGRKTVSREMIGKAQEVKTGQSDGEAWVNGVSSEILDETGGGSSDPSIGGIDIVGPGIVKPAILPKVNSPEEIAKRAASVIRAAIPELDKKMAHIGNVTRKVQEVFPEGSGGGQKEEEPSGLDKLEEYLQTLGMEVSNKCETAVLDGYGEVIDGKGYKVDPKEYENPDALDKELSEEEKEKKQKELDEAEAKAEREMDEQDERAKKLREEAATDPNNPYHDDPNKAFSWVDENGVTQYKTKRELLEEEKAREAETDPKPPTGVVESGSEYETVGKDGNDIEFEAGSREEDLYNRFKDRRY